MNPTDSSSSGDISRRHSSFWDHPSPTDYTTASEGGLPPVQLLDVPAAGAQNLPVGPEIPPLGPVHGVGVFLVPTEVLDPAIGGVLDEAQNGFVQDWLDGLDVFVLGPSVDEVQYTVSHIGIGDASEPIPEQTVPPETLGQDHGLVPSASSLDVELDDITPSPTLLDPNPSHLAPEDIDTALLGVGEGVQPDSDDYHHPYPTV